MTRTDHVDHVQVMRRDQPIEMDVEEIQPRRRAPVSKKPRLDVRECERLFEQWISAQIDLAD